MPRSRRLNVVLTCYLYYSRATLHPRDEQPLNYARILFAVHQTGSPSLKNVWAKAATRLHTKNAMACEKWEAYEKYESQQKQLCAASIYSHVTCVLAYIRFLFVYCICSIHFTHTCTHTHTQTLAFVSRHVRSIAIFFSLSSSSHSTPFLTHDATQLLPLLLALLLPPFNTKTYHMDEIPSSTALWITPSSCWCWKTSAPLPGSRLSKSRHVCYSLAQKPEQN